MSIFIWKNKCECKFINGLKNKQSNFSLKSKIEFNNYLS